MFLHIGGDVIVPEKEIIAIINYSKKKNNQINKEYLSITEEEGFVKYLCKKDKGKSFVIAGNKIYISPISAATLQKRSKMFNLYV